jgi:hypothetical protein
MSTNLKAGEGLLLCKQALERLVKQKPNIKKFIGVTITPSVVSQEAGFGSGYLKKTRHSDFIDKIADVNKELEKSPTAVTQNKLNKAKNAEQKSRQTANNYKQMLEQALSREIHLLCRIRELEAELNKSNKKD